MSWQGHFLAQLSVNHQSVNSGQTTSCVFPMSVNCETFDIFSEGDILVLLDIEACSVCRTLDYTTCHDSKLVQS